MPGYSSSALSGLCARIRSLVRGVRRRSEVEAEMSEEFGHHIELRTEDLIRTGLSAGEAARRARLEFGPVEALKERARASRGLRPIDELRFSWLDVKLGLRMLAKHPGLTVAAVFALAVGIPVGMAPMHLSNALTSPLPEDADNRIRAIRYWRADTATAAEPTYYDFDYWRQELATFDALGATRTGSYNATPEGGGPGAPVLGAEVTASTFVLLGTPPLMGRWLVASDEAVGAPQVAVVGYDFWQSRLAGDPAVVGRTIEIARTPHTVVGVMPEGFRFPVLQQLWIPLREEIAAEPGRGLGLRVFGRLAQGASEEEAQAEVGAVGLRLAAEFPDARGRLRAEVVPFGLSAVGLPRGGLESLPGFYFFQLLALALLLVASANVALLVFARTATRFRELALRAALGASRTRLVSQLFVETLVLAVLAAAVGLAACDWILGHLRSAILATDATLPYWLTLGVTREAVVRALVLGVLSATVAGVVPALRITGRRSRPSVQIKEAGASGIRFGRGTSALIIADVAIAVAVVGFALGLADRTRIATAADELVGIPAEEYLAAALTLPASAPADAFDREGFARRLGATQRRLSERLEAEPRVLSVTVASSLPRMDQRSRRVEVEGVEASGRYRGRYLRTAEVDVGFFEALDQPILAGRGFDRRDLAENPRPVIVNTVFVDRWLGGRDAVGRRLRFLASNEDQDAPWHEIIGVVGHLGMNVVDPEGDEGVYVPAPPGAIHPMQLAIHLGGDPETFAPRLRELVAEADPAAVLGRPVVLSDVYQGDWWLLLGIVGGLGLLLVILVTLAASGVYAMMSFSVTERTREIGIRTALGASRGSVLATLLRRSLLEIGSGAVIGIPLAGFFLFAFEQGSGGTSAGSALLWALLFGAGVVILVGFLSCLAPARRALSIQPSEALRAE